MTTTLRLTSRQDVEDLLADLRSALRRSLRTGGAYSVYRLAHDGSYLLSIEVSLSPRERMEAKK